MNKKEIILNENDERSLLEDYKKEMESLDWQEMKTIHAKRRYYFKDLLPDDYNNLYMDEEAAYSVTEAKMADTMTSYIIRSAHDNGFDVKTITDATACVGGNAISFMFVFEHVEAFEIDTKRSKYLYHNMNLVKNTKVIKTHSNNNRPLFGSFSVYNNDFCGINMNEITTDVVFFDPPWGGIGYKDKTDIHLYLSGQDIQDICIKCMSMRKVKMVALKVPYNFAFDDFMKSIEGHDRGIQHIIYEIKEQNKKTKFELIVLFKKPKP